MIVPLIEPQRYFRYITVIVYVHVGPYSNNYDLSDLTSSNNPCHNISVLGIRSSFFSKRRIVSEWLVLCYRKGCTGLAAAFSTLAQLLAHGRWFSPGIPTSSTTKTGRHDIAKILLKVALNTINQIKSNRIMLGVFDCGRDK